MTVDHPDTHLSTEERQRPAVANGSRSEFVLTILCDLVLPIGLYYLLRAAGMGELPALLVSGSPPAVHTLYTMTKHRRVDTLGVFVLVLVVLGAAASLISGSPRAVLVRGGVLSGAISLWILSTVFLARPFTYRALEALLPGKRARLDRYWREDAAFRRVWHRLTVMWGVGLLLDSLARIAMALTLPVDSVPALEGILYAVTWVLLQVISQIVLKRTGTFAKIFDRREPDDPLLGADGESTSRGTGPERSVGTGGAA